ncbi:MAG: Crp/Fnr family transcriptional regulator [Terriglobales bacterium]
MAPLNNVSGTFALDDPMINGIPIWSRVVGRGAVLGLPSSISGEPYTLTAVAIENVDARFLSRSTLCELMTSDGSIANQVVGLISEELADLRRKMSLMKHATDARIQN